VCVGTQTVSKLHTGANLRLITSLVASST